MVRRSSDFSFLLTDVKIGVDPVVLFFADERPHLGVAFERRTELDALGFFGHGFDEFGINLFFDQDAAAGGTDFALIDEHAEERAIHGGFPIGVGEENVRRFAAEFERDALERVRGALDDDFADSGAAGESDFVHVGMRDDSGAGGFAKAVDDVDDARRETGFFKPIREF